jgi:signal transduction histidine kinase
MAAAIAAGPMDCPAQSGAFLNEIGWPVQAGATIMWEQTRTVVASAVSQLEAALVTHDIQALLNVIERWRAGDSGARVPLPDDGSEISQLAHTLNGLQDRIAGLEQDVEQLTARLQKASEAETQLGAFKKRFSSMVTHEFRNPLATIQLYADVLKKYDHKLSDEKRLENVEKILSRVKFLSGVLDDIVTISEAETVGLDFDPAPLNLDALCREIVEDMQPADGTAPQIVYASDMACGLFSGDEKLLYRILSNLLSNALKYSLNGGVVHVDLRCHQGEVVLAVTDQGIGIPRDDMERLFDLFHRARNSAGIPGTGLGLAIARRAAEAHGGTIVVESSEGVGSTFTVRLPMGN